MHQAAAALHSQAKHQRARMTNLQAPRRRRGRWGCEMEAQLATTFAAVTCRPLLCRIAAASCGSHPHWGRRW